MDIILREAALADAAELAALESECFPSDRISYRQFRYQISRGRSVILLAEDALCGDIAGYGVCFIPSARRTARLYSLAVLPAYRRKGIAVSLLKRLLERVRGCGFSYCNLEVRCSDEGTQRLYEGFGFREIRRLEKYYADGEAALRMRAVL